VAVTRASLRTNNPEFEDAPDDVIDAKIANATARVSTTVVGDTVIDNAVEQLACHLLALSPFARDMRLVREDSTTIYMDEYHRIIESQGRAYRVLP